MDEAWAPQKKHEEQQIMWLNKLPPGVKIPLTAQQMAKVAKMEVYGNQAEMKEHTGSSSSYGIPDKQNDRETHMQPGSAKILKKRMFAAANTNSNDSTTSHTKEAYKGYTCTETSGNKIMDHQETKGMGSNDKETSVSTGTKQKEACSSSQKHSTGESKSSSEEQAIKPKTKEELQDDDPEINPDPPTKMEEEMDKMFNSDDNPAVDEIISAAIPKEGARFKTRDDTFYRYALYARKIGFAMKKFSSKRSGKNGEIYMQKFTCNKEGCTNTDAKTSSQRRTNTLVKSDCKAHIIVREFEGFWYIKKVHLEHNHPLEPTDYLISLPFPPPDPLAYIGPNLSHPMASVCSPRRQLAPTVGPAAALAGVFIRTGSLIATGERVVSGLVQRLSALDYVSDNAGDFSTGAFPRNGVFINFGVHRVYVGTVPANRYPDVVHVAADPPAILAARGRRTARPASCEVMMAGTGAEARKEADAEKQVPAKSARPSKPGYERAENLAAQASTSSAQIPNPLQAAIVQLYVPVTSAADIALTREQLEEQRLSILHEANEVARVRQELDITLREYNTTQGLANDDEPSRVHIRLRGKNLNKEITRNGRAESSMSATHILAPKPVYSTHAQNLRAAQAAAAELQHLTGGALRKQQARVKELVDIASMQNAECAKANPGAGASQVVHSARDVPGKSKGQASSPHVDAKHAGSVSSKQMTMYDPVEAGKRVAEQGNTKQGNAKVGRNSQAADRGHVDNRPQGRHGANSAAGGHAPHYPARSQDRHNDGDTAMINAGYRRLDQARHAEPLGDRLGARHLPAYDARHRLDRIYLTEQLEVQGPPGTACFGPRIMREVNAVMPAIPEFMLPRDTRTYDGSTKPEDWLIDYATAVYVAGGNRRWAVRFVPSVLVGPARIWLNNLPAGSIDGWIDFEEAFVSNFSSTYKRPNRPQQLSLCQQRKNETDREYLTRWSAMRNSCEGVIEAQAISWFANGCRRGSMLWQRLQRDMPVTLADMIWIADSYALGDPTQLAFTTDMQPRPPPRPDFRNSNNNQSHKRREDFPDSRYGLQLVAAVTPDQPEAEEAMGR
ncbi:hypothetical protein ACQ4PT_060393 [Festuca glaucescens]